VLPPLLEIAPDAVVVVVSNPVDVITYAALKILGLPRNQVLGSGTVLDSSRLRALIAAHCGVAVQSVHAYIAGEHGDSEIPLWTSATVGAVPLLEWNDQQQLPMTAADRDDLAGQVINAGYRILHGKGHTNHAVALATARIIEAVLYDEHQVLPAMACAGAPIQYARSSSRSGSELRGTLRVGAPLRQSRAQTLAIGVSCLLTEW
jgi:L-lactate dehydrogenase